MSPPDSDSADGASGSPVELTEKLLDFLVYAPIGLVLDAQTVAPDLARRGRQHTAAARQIGELAVKAGLRRLEQARAGDQDDPASQDRPVKADEPTKPAKAPAIRSDHLAIEDYDLLAASQVVKRLDSLTSSELQAVAAYETATRGRRTILNKVAKLTPGHPSTAEQ